MFPTAALEPGKRYIFRGEILTYHSITKGLKPTKYVFKNAEGKRKQISKAILQTELWEELETNV